MNTEHNIQCVGFIMDGNRRWAKAQGVPTLEGHAKGYSVMKDMVGVIQKTHIPHVICYAFSTENWNRSEMEVGYLMELLQRGLSEMRADFKKDTAHINLRIIGQIERLPKQLQEEIARIEAENVETPTLTLWLAISYGGRAEIIDAINRSIDKGEQVTEDTFSKMLWTNGMPDPDLIIRTSGEVRLSNFLLWQSAYSELFFTDTLWPDFGESEFQSIVEQYTKRQRRKGV